MEPHGLSRSERIGRYAYLSVVVVAALAMAVMSWQLRETNQDLDKEINARITQVEMVRVQRAEEADQINRNHCRAIEDLKRQWRNTAIENYKRLDENLELLGLARTVAIERRARESRDTILERFKKADCDDSG